jgi:hypothetical protein
MSEPTDQYLFPADLPRWFDNWCAEHTELFDRTRGTVTRPQLEEMRISFDDDLLPKGYDKRPGAEQRLRRFLREQGFALPE